MKKKLYYETLTTAMKQDVYAWIEAHNLKFYGKRKSHPGRIKPPDTTCLFNILRAWAVQATRTANAGGIITNRVFINNIDMAPGDSHKTNTGRYLGKLAFARLIGGRKAGEESPLRYQSQFENPAARGFGWEPLKRLHGAHRPYEILINPSILPLHAFPGDCLIQLYAGFAEEAANGAIVHNPELMVESFHLPKEKREAFKAENLIDKKACLNGTSLLEEAQRQAQKAEASQGEKQEVFGGRVIFSGGSNEERPPISTKIPPKLDLEAEVLSEEQVLRGGIAFLHKLQSQGKQLQVMAITLIWAYLNKLAAVMKDREGKPRQYLSSCVHAGYIAILRVLLMSNDPKKQYDRMIQVIDRVHQRIVHDPKSAFAAPPNLFFDPDFKLNFEWWDKNYLQPWERTRERFEDFRLMAHKVSEQDKKRDWALGQRSKYGIIAWSIKKWAMVYHPNDHRLRKADLLRWTIHVRLLVEKDGVPYDRAYQIAKWLMTSKDAKAKYWRTEFSGHGIRSTSGFRKRFHLIETDYVRIVAAKTRKGYA